jgi:nickel-dependent lactate racemase
VVITLPYGTRPLSFDVGGRSVRVVAAPSLPAAKPIADSIREALDAPIGMQLPTLARGARVTLIVSDASRVEPRAAFAAAIRERYPDVRWTLAIATGTHQGAVSTANELGGEFERVIVHDAHVPDDLVELGTTSRGTPVRVHRCVVDTQLVVATGCIRPHYFAGFGGGSKAVFPGLGEARAIRINHRWKTDPMARAGVLQGNPCREDIEEAVGMLAAPVLLLDALCGPDDELRGAVAGDRVEAFRVGAELVRGWLTVAAPRAKLVIASDALPITASLYQAAKIAASTAPLVEAGGTLVIAAECADGVGPLETVNEEILRIGVLPRLAPGVEVRLLSAIPDELVGRTLLRPARSLEQELAMSDGSVVVIPRASRLLYA